MRQFVLGILILFYMADAVECVPFKQYVLDLYNSAEGKIYTLNSKNGTANKFVIFNFGW